jgi:hypothetical protein
MENHLENMHVWIANESYGVSFTVQGRRYGGVTMWSSFITRIPFLRKLNWRYTVQWVAVKMSQDPWMDKAEDKWPSNHVHKLKKV